MSAHKTGEQIKVPFRVLVFNERQATTFFLLTWVLKTSTLLGGSFNITALLLLIKPT